MPNLLNRDPKGRFMWRADALTVWLPALMEASRNCVFDHLLSAAIRFAESRAAMSHRNAAKYLELRDEHMYQFCTKRVAYFLAVREVLIDARLRLARLPEAR